MKGRLYRNYIKRLIDFIAAFVAIIVLSPVLFIVAIIVLTKLGRPVIFKQKRPGLNDEIFTMYKFRTMTDEKDDNGELLLDNIRLSKLGQFLRSTSLDELPELFNILKGDMSFIGPRPLSIEYLPYYTDTERIRHSVRPGLSGLAQVNGRNSIIWEQRFYFDLRYVSGISLFLDMKIVMMTFFKVIQRKDIGIRGINAVPDFHIYRQNITKGK